VTEPVEREKVLFFLFMLEGNVGELGLAEIFFGQICRCRAEKSRFALSGILEIFMTSGCMIIRIFGIVFARKGNKNCPFSVYNLPYSHQPSV